MDQRGGLRVQGQGATQRCSGALPRVVVWRGASATKRKHRVTRGKSAAQGRHDVRWPVAHARRTPMTARVIAAC